jgi:two-component system cell cycle sensor histidine kinase/response regulator CckA
MSSSRGTKKPSTDDCLAALEALDDVVVCVDTDLRITTWNDAAATLHSLPASDAHGKALLQLVAPESRAAEGKLLELVLAGKAAPRHDTIFLRPDGTGVPLSVAIGPIKSSGKVTGAILLGRDIAAQQRLQLQLLQAKRMESSGHLAGGVAHEFNNILTAILALAEFTARELPPDTGPQEDLKEIRQQATKGARLVRHLLAFSRRQLLRTEVVQLGTIFQELEPLLQRLVSERVLLATEVAADSPPVEIDRALLELVILELVANATDAMESGGTLSVSTRTVRVGADRPGLAPGDYVQITVQDTGSGFDVAAHPRVMEPFYSTKGDGHAGLGLAMVDGVIQQHHGAVTVESKPGAGTTVRILLPASRRPMAATDSAPVSTGDHRGNETLLVVEDETAVRNVICRSLRGRGYNVLEAKNGEDALLVAERHNAPIHLVVTDVVMPEMGGTELYGHLRRWYPTMRILFISGYTKGAIPPEALEEGGGAGFLPKPFTLDQLAAEVRRVIMLPRPRVASNG